MSKNRVVNAPSGWLMILVNLMLYAGAVVMFVNGVRGEMLSAVILGVLVFILASFVSGGFFIINPNYAALLVLFGRYKGTVASNGFFWTNPFNKVIKISLRVRNQETNKLKVNEKSGNPVDIAAVVVWRVVDPYNAQFEIDEYTQYVSVQSESALRNLATHYYYDGEDHEVTLRGNTDDVNARLQMELQERLDRAGVEVMEARLSHLAYAAEIASEMLRRQQAEAVVAARKKIVEGAVGMVEHALEQLGAKQIVELDNERKAAMVSNLMVVLCSESSATPVVNAGTLYQ